MDRAERLIRDAKPPTPPISPRAEADLARILASKAEAPASTTHKPHRSVRWAWAAAAALVIAMVIAGIDLARPKEALAATPPMPTITATAEAPADALHDLQARAAAQPDRSEATEIATRWWALGSDVDATGKITVSTVDPRRRVATLGAHGIISYTDYAALPYDAAGRPVSDPTAPPPGTQLDYVTVEPDQQIFTDPPPTKPSLFGDYLADHLPLNSPSATSNAFTGIRMLMAERILAPAQQSAFLGYLASLSDVQILGDSTDRLGRRVLVFAAPLQQDHQTLLMISSDTGQIAATEVIYRGTDRTDIPTPAVIEYVAWETP